MLRWAALGPANRHEILARLADAIDAGVPDLAKVECVDNGSLYEAMSLRVLPRAELEIGHDGIDQAVRAEPRVEEVPARADDAEARRLRDQLVTERPDLVGPSLRDLLRPADRRGPGRRTASPRT